MSIPILLTIVVLIQIIPGDTAPYYIHTYLPLCMNVVGPLVSPQPPMGLEFDKPHISGITV